MIQKMYFGVLLWVQWNTKPLNQTMISYCSKYLHFMGKCPLHSNAMKLLTSSSLGFGTLQMQLVPKFVSLCWIQRRQHRFS